MKHKEGQKPYLSLKGIDRFFGITKALQKVDLDIYEGEVIGLVGPNGAGKSTMMKILTGVLPKTAGQIIYNGVPEENYNAKIAKQIGVSCAYQDLSLCTNLSIFENFAMLNVSHSIAPSKNWRNKTKTEVEKLLEKYFPGRSRRALRTGSGNDDLLLQRSKSNRRNYQRRMALYRRYGNAG